MPCDTVTKNFVVLEKAQPELIKAAIAEVERKLYCRITWTAGKGITVTAGAGDAEQVRKAVVQAYSKQAVSWAASKAGFKVTAAGDNKLRLTR